MAGPAVPIRAYARIRGNQAAPVLARNSIKILTRRTRRTTEDHGERVASHRLIGRHALSVASVVLRSSVLKASFVAGGQDIARFPPAAATRRCSSKGAATARPHAPVRSMTQRRRSAGWPPATDPARDGHRDRATAERGAMWRRHPMSSGALALPATSNAADVFPDRKNPIHREAATRWAEPA